MTSPVIERWSDLPQYKRASGINIKWIGADQRVWDIGGYNEGAQGAIITGPVRGMVHVPFKGIWHEPAYGPPRFERAIDERREISFPITLISDSEYGWLDTESFWWNGMRRDTFGWFALFTRRYGELYIPMMLLDSIEDELEEDPTNNGNNSQTWHIKIAADGEPRWRTPDIRPAEWVVKATDPIKQIKRDDNVFAPLINVRQGKLKAANRGTEPSWPVYTVSAPGRCWLPDGLTGRMIRVPQLFPGEHVLIDTDPRHKIAISLKDPTPNWLQNIISNVDLLKWLGIIVDDSSETVLERFHGQGFTAPIPAGTVATLPILHSQVGARVSVRVPQRFERAIS
jgi:hypothetical protein